MQTAFMGYKQKAMKNNNGREGSGNQKNWPTSFMYELFQFDLLYYLSNQSEKKILKCQYLFA